MGTDSDIIEGTNHNFVYKNPYKVMTIIFAIIVLGLAGLTIYLFVDNNDKFKQIADLRAFIATFDENTPAIGNETPPTIDPSDEGEYVMLPNVGIMIPLSEDIQDKIEVVEVGDDAYRFDVKTISEYREQGYCSNGGSGAIGMVKVNSVSIQNNAVGGDTGLMKTQSQWSSHTIAKFENNVVYPDEYVSFSNLDAVCYDSKDGHEQRLQEVAEEVQEINDALERAFLHAVSI